jgi:hypothetical protein
MARRRAHPRTDPLPVAERPITPGLPNSAPEGPTRSSRSMFGGGSLRETGSLVEAISR